jgi:hypothetical protein
MRIAADQFWPLVTFSPVAANPRPPSLFLYLQLSNDQKHDKYPQEPFFPNHLGGGK